MAASPTVSSAAPARPAPQSARTLARSALGITLREPQARAIASLLSGRDTLVVMPTGAGKSAIYQVAGALIPGATVVVSPLIALQRDQVLRIGDELGGAVQVNSTLGDQARRDALRSAAAGHSEFLFLAPEQLANEETRERIRRANPSLFVVDEAHLISSWGESFRPEYRRLGAMIRELGHPTIVALTATAAPPVREDIAARLGMRDPDVVVAGFFRPNIRLAVHVHGNEQRAERALLKRAAGLRGSGIVYVPTRARAEQLAALLAVAGVDAMPYHAGMKTSERSAVHDRFLAPEPSVVVATTAFGMGIDAPHVRFVLHDGQPESIDAYYQEAGRAGRDGRRAVAEIFAVAGDAGGRRFGAGVGDIDTALALRIAFAVREAKRVASVEELPGDNGERRRTLDRLEETGSIAIAADGSIEWIAGRTTPKTAVARAVEATDRRREIDRTRGEMMRRYVEAAECRWRLILSYLGEPSDAACERCDACAGRGAKSAGATAAANGAPAAATPEQPIPLGARVKHKSWGTGSVVSYESRSMTVLFDDAGYKTLAVDVVAQGKILRPA